MHIPQKYIPSYLSSSDKIRQQEMLMNSRAKYKKGVYSARKGVPSYKHKTSKHINKAKKIYSVDAVVPSPKLAAATGCTVDALEKIVNKGRGAYYSSGSRPNQTAESWGLARLASSITGGKSAVVDFHILENGCNHRKTAYRMAEKAKKNYKYKKNPAAHLST